MILTRQFQFKNKKQNTKIMKFLISEEEKSRILEMHQNATSRQYLMEETIANTQAASFVNEFNRVMVAYKLPTYVAKFIKGADDYHGNIVIYKDGKELVKSPQDFGIAVTANLSPGVQQTKDPLDNYGTKLVDGKLIQFTNSLINVLNTADATVKNQLAAAVRSGVDAVKKQLSPTQK
jgi:hypothetical protein